MSECTAEEIAEKKRIALERLKAKKNQLSNGKISMSVAKPKQDEVKAQSIQKISSLNAAGNFYEALKKSDVVKNHLEAAPYPKKLPLARANIESKSVTSNVEPNRTYSVFCKVITCSVYIVSQNRFAVEPISYHSKLIEVFKTIPSKSFDVKTKLWTFGLKDYELVQEHVGNLRPDVVIGEIPRNILELCRKSTNLPNSSCLASIEPKLVEELMPFQRQGVCFAIGQHGRAMICDEMGLGKTHQALAVADFYKEDWPLLISTTALLRNTWASHIRNLLPSVPCHNILVHTSTQQYLGDAKILITSYNLMERHGEGLLEKNFGFLIFDESHTLKNGKAKCTILADKLSTKAKRILLLSGTPALSRPIELFSQLRMINRRFMSFTEYTSRYCDAKQGKFGIEVNGQSNLAELNVVLNLKFMIRRLKSDVLPQMAEKSRETVALDPELIWTSRNVKESLNKYVTDLSQSKGKMKEEILLRFYAETAAIKTRAVCAYLKTLLKRKKFIVFAHHKVMLDAISRCFDNEKVDYIRIDGTTRNDLRNQYVETFQKKSSCMAAILSLKACNAGITLTEAEMVIFAELDWNPSTLAQAESRAHRIGQQKPVICRYLLAANTVDDVIWNMLKSKQDVLSQAGLFCENLQNASHSAAALNAKKIEQYFPVVDSSKNVQKKGEKECYDDLFEDDLPLPSNMKEKTPKNNIEDLFDDDFTLPLTMEIEWSKNKEIENLLDDDDDDVFKDLNY